MIDWKITSRASRCYFSDKPFVKGNRVTTFLFRNKEDFVQRIDLLEGEEKDPNFEYPSVILGRWTREITDPENSRKYQQEALINAEECFVSLFSQENQPEIDVFKQLLSLRLEQKRILRAVNFDENEQIQIYFHPKRQMEYRVSTKLIDSELLVKIQGQLEKLLLY